MSAKQSDREYQKSKKDRQYDRRDKPVSQPTSTVVFHLVTFQEDASFVPAFCLGLIAASFALSLVNSASITSQGRSVSEAQPEKAR
jgi:hypothetical protein